MTDRATYLARTFAASFEALKELAKTQPAEAASLAASLASHLRSAWPMATIDTGPVPRPDPTPVAAIERALSDGGRYRLANEDGVAVLELVDFEGDRAVASLTLAEGGALRADIEAVQA